VSVSGTPDPVTFKHIEIVLAKSKSILGRMLERPSPAFIG